MMHPSLPGEAHKAIKGNEEGKSGYGGAPKAIAAPGGSGGSAFDLFTAPHQYGKNGVKKIMPSNIKSNLIEPDRKSVV